jgi:hypothetical protein
MTPDPHSIHVRLASSIFFSIVRYLWYNPAIQIALVRVLF